MTTPADIDRILKLVQDAYRMAYYRMIYDQAIATRTHTP